MRRPSLRSQLNQIRLWVRQGRTDAWIAHKLDITVEQLEQFKREQRLDVEPGAEPDPVVVGETPLIRPPVRRAPEPVGEPEQDEPDEDEDEDEEVAVEGEKAERGGRRAAAGRRRRRGRRGGRGRSRPAQSFEATFEHGGEGYGLWLDPAVVDNPVYSEHWAGHREVTVTFDADSITIKRAERERD